MTSNKYKGLTPHNDAKKGDIAKTVLMPGDPLRAKYIADNFLQDVKKVNNVRGMLAFTGNYKGKKVTIMGSGMGIPSIGIYSSELFEFYGVDNIMRVGSTAATHKDIKLYDIIVAETSVTDSTYYYSVNGESKYELKGSPLLINHTKKEAKKLKINNKLFIGKVNSTDAFYRTPKMIKKFKEDLIKQNIIGIEMESFALYTNAKRFQKNALTILCVSDHSLTGEVTTAQERETSFTNMMELALNVATNL